MARRNTLQENIDTYNGNGNREKPVLERSTDKRTKEVADIELHTKPIGVPGTTIFSGLISEEYLTEWNTLPKRVESITRMLSSDATVKALQYSIELPIRSAIFDVMYGPEADMYLSKEYQQQMVMGLKKNLFEELETPWDDIIRQALQACFYGFYIFEIIHMTDGDTVKLKDLSPRIPSTIDRWLIGEGGKFLGIKQRAPFPKADDKVEYKTVPIPAKYLCRFTYRQDGSNFEGSSILRAAFKHFYFKDKVYLIQGIGLERNAIGEPIFKLPPNYTPNMREYAENLVKAWRTHEEGGAVIPPNAELTTSSGRIEAAAIMYAIQHHDTEICKSILAHFINLGTEGRGGAYSLGVEMTDFFMLGLKATANWLCDTINKQVIKPLILLNDPDTQVFPKLVIKELGRLDRAGYATMLTTLVQARLLTPDKELEAWAREVFEIPPMGGTANTMRDGEQVEAEVNSNELLSRLYAPTQTEQMLQQQQMQQEQQQQQMGMQQEQHVAGLASQEQQAGLQAEQQQAQLVMQAEKQKADIAMMPAQLKIQAEQAKHPPAPNVMYPPQNNPAKKPKPNGRPQSSRENKRLSEADGMLDGLLTLRDELIARRDKSLDLYVDDRHVSQLFRDAVYDEIMTNGQKLVDISLDMLDEPAYKLSQDELTGFATALADMAGSAFNGTDNVFEETYKFVYAARDPKTGVFAPKEGGVMRKALTKALESEARRAVKGMSKGVVNNVMGTIPYMPEGPKRFVSTVATNTVTELMRLPTKKLIDKSIDSFINRNKTKNGAPVNLGPEVMPELMNDIRGQLPGMVEKNIPDWIDQGKIPLPEKQAAAFKKYAGEHK